MPAGPRKPVERHNGRVYWPTRDVAVGFVDFFHAPGRILGTQTFRAAGGFSRRLPTHTFFGLPSPSQFSYTHFFGLPSASHFTSFLLFSFYLHTLFRAAVTVAFAF